MGIQFETDYNMETLTAMAKGPVSYTHLTLPTNSLV